MASGKTIDRKMTPVLSGKLRPPRLHNVLARPRLLEMAAIPGKRGVVSICAGPGFGKTTLMAQLAETLPGGRVWYQIDSLDRDPAMFLRHFIVAITAVCETAGGRAMSRLESSDDIHQDGVNVLGVLADGLKEGLKEPMTIYFDDFYLLDDADFASRFLGFFIENLPPAVMVVISSRTRPNLEVGRAHSRKVVYEIGEDDLKFSSAELEELVKDTWRLDIASDGFRQLYKNTEGWAAGLVLLEDYLKGGGDIPELFARKHIRQNIYELLAEEVLHRQPGEMQNLLLQSSLLETVDPAICNEALGIDDAGRLFANAENRNLFTTRMEDTGYFRFHPLFREFLRARLTENSGAQKVKALHGRFAQAFEAAGDHENAVEHYLAADDKNDAIRLIEELGEKMLDNGEYMTLGRWLDGLKEADISPALGVYRGRILMAKGKMTEAVSSLRATKSKIDPDDLNLLGRCSLAISICLSALDRYKDVKKELKPLLEFPLDSSLRMEVLYRLAICCWCQFDMKGVNFYIKGARELAKKGKDLYLLNSIEAAHYLRMGLLYKACEALNEAIKAFDITSTYKNLLTNNLVSVLTLMAEYDKASSMIEKVLENIRLQREYELLALAMDTKACILLAEGNYQECERLFNKAIEIARSMDFAKQDLSFCYMHLGTMARRKGDYIDAFEQHKKSILISRRIGDLYTLAEGFVNIAADLIRLGRPAEAEGYLNKAIDLATKHEFYSVMTKIDYHRAWGAHLEGNEESEIRHLTSALRRASNLQHNHFIIQEGKISLPLLTTALKNNIETDYILWVLGRIGEPSLPAVEPLLETDDMEMRNRISILIGKIGGANALALLRRALCDPDERVRRTARIAVREARSKLKSLDEILTEREAEVLNLLSQGLSNAGVAKRLFISERTVKVHVGNIFKKLGLTSRLEAALYFQQQNNGKNPPFST